MAHRLAVPGETRGAVREVAEPLLLPDRDAAVRTTAAAVDALAALGCEQRHDVIAGGQRADALADALHHPCALVPEHAGRIPARVRPRGGEEVGVAHATGHEPHEDLSCKRLREVELLNRERTAELLEDGGADLHSAPFGVVTPAFCAEEGVVGARSGSDGLDSARLRSDDPAVRDRARCRPGSDPLPPGAAVGRASRRRLLLADQRPAPRVRGDAAPLESASWSTRSPASSRTAYGIVSGTAAICPRISPAGLRAVCTLT